MKKSERYGVFAVVVIMVALIVINHGAGTLNWSQDRNGAIDIDDYGISIDVVEVKVYDDIQSVRLLVSSSSKLGLKLVTSNLLVSARSGVQNFDYAFVGSVVEAEEAFYITYRFPVSLATTLKHINEDQQPVFDVVVYFDDDTRLQKQYAYQKLLGNK